MVWLRWKFASEKLMGHGLSFRLMSPWTEPWLIRREISENAVGKSPQPMKHLKAKYQHPTYPYIYLPKETHLSPEFPLSANFKSVLGATFQFCIDRFWVRMHSPNGPNVRSSWPWHNMAHIHWGKPAIVDALPFSRSTWSRIWWFHDFPCKSSVRAPLEILFHSCTNSPWGSNNTLFQLRSLGGFCPCPTYQA